MKTQEQRRGILGKQETGYKDGVIWILLLYKKHNSKVVIYSIIYAV